MIKNFLSNKTFKSEALINEFSGKNILVTGGTGSFGKAFIENILINFSPNKLIVFSRDELKQFEMQQKFSQKKYPCMRFFLGDIRDEQRLSLAMQGVDIVVHAAAMKHVEASEYNPFECIKTNVLGSQNIVMASIKNNVKKVIALSTDKAAAPANIYGASKLASDKLFINAENLSGGTPIFSVVRYGNVIGSRGSIYPFFKKLLDEKSDHLPLTDERMTRFCISLKQGVEFVISCIVMMEGRELFIPKIPSIKIIDFCNWLAPNIPVKIIGIRPGEKLHELMFTKDDSRDVYFLDDRFIVLSQEAIKEKERKYSKFLTKTQNDIEYSSETNEEFLNKQTFLDLIKNI